MVKLQTDQFTDWLVHLQVHLINRSLYKREDSNDQVSMLSCICECMTHSMA